MKINKFIGDLLLYTYTNTKQRNGWEEGNKTGFNCAIRYALMG